MYVANNLSTILSPWIHSKCPNLDIPKHRDAKASFKISVPVTYEEQKRSTVHGVQQLESTTCEEYNN